MLLIGRMLAHPLNCEYVGAGFAITGDILTAIQTVSEREQSLLVTATSAGLVFVHGIVRSQNATVSVPQCGFAARVFTHRDVQELKYSQHAAPHSSAVNDIDVQHDRLVLASAGEDGQVHLVSLADLKTRSTLCK